MTQFCVYWFENGSHYTVSGKNSKAEVKKIHGIMKSGKTDDII